MACSFLDLRRKYLCVRVEASSNADKNRPTCALGSKLLSC